MSDYDKMVGKVVARVEDNGKRNEFGDDPGLTIYFTDGSSFDISAGMGQGCGYLCEEFNERA